MIFFSIEQVFKVHFEKLNFTWSLLIFFYTNLFILIGGDCYKLSLRKTEAADALFLGVRSYFYQVQAWFVFMQRVKHYLKFDENKIIQTEKT